MNINSSLNVSKTGLFSDPDHTATGEDRASVDFQSLQTLWLNTGTLCNIECAHCYIESSPSNDSLLYLTEHEAATFFDEIHTLNLPTSKIGITGGEPFMNPDIIAIIEDSLKRGFSVLVLTNAMKPMERHKANLKRLADCYGERLTLRVSLDHYDAQLHEVERGANTWRPTIAGLKCLADNGISFDIAGRR